MLQTIVLFLLGRREFSYLNTLCCVFVSGARLRIESLSDTCGEERCR